MGKFETANDLAILAAGRVPQWDAPSEWDGAPASESSGVYLVNALVAVCDVRLRTTAHRRTAVVTVSVLDLAADYTVEIDAFVCVATGAHADLDALLTEIAAIVNSTAGATVTATADLTADTVTIVGDAQDDFAIDISATGAGVLACVADASTATVFVWALYKEGNDNTPEGWRHPFDAEYAIDWSGYSDRFTVGGLDRLYLEVRALAGFAGDGGSVTLNDPVVRIGPCVTE